MGRELSDNIKGVVDQISDLTADLLSEGEDPAQIAWALTTVAIDMSLQICNEPLRVVPVLLGAISTMAEHHMLQREDADGLWMNQWSLNCPVWIAAQLIRQTRIFDVLI